MVNRTITPQAPESNMKAAYAASEGKNCEGGSGNLVTRVRTSSVESTSPKPRAILGLGAGALKVQPGPFLASRQTN